MRPFNPDPITDRSRELFGTYMRRYETPPSMSAFDAPISDRRRELYGEQMSRWSTRKTASQSYVGQTNANGLNWVSTDATSIPFTSTNNVSIYQVYFWRGGGWAGNAHFRIMIDGVKVYPFAASKQSVDFTYTSLGTLWTTVRPWETCSVEFQSDNAGDVGPPQVLHMYLNVTEHVLVP